MIRVCFSMLMLLLLSACAVGQPSPATSAQNPQPNSAAQPQENILACTGLPVAGQKCGLALPKL